MVATPSMELSQASVFSITSGETANIQISQAFVLSVSNFPTEQVELSQSLVQVLTAGPTKDIELSQSFVIAVVRGRVDDPSIRAWAFTLDGHDFYVLRLGNEETLIYDVLTDQWSQWGTADTGYWSVYTGSNWVGGNGFAANQGSNVIVGSDANGALFFLDPNKPEDDAVVTGRDPSPFRRRVTGQLPLRGYDSARVYEVQVLGSVSDLDLGADPDIELLYSDDRGDNYVSAGVITTVDQDFDIRANWRSLGSFRSPGRLFRLEDYGALKRIDSITVNTSMADGA